MRGYFRFAFIMSTEIIELLFYAVIYYLVKCLVKVGLLINFILVQPYNTIKFFWNVGGSLLLALKKWLNRLITYLFAILLPAFQYCIITPIVSNLVEVVSNSRQRFNSYFFRFLGKINDLFYRIKNKTKSNDFSFSNFIIFLSSVILVCQICFISLRLFLANFLRQLRIIIFLPVELFRLSLTTSFRYFYFGFIFCLFVVSIFHSYNFLRSLPSPYHIGKTNYPLSTHIYDRNGRLLYEIYRDQNRTPIKLKDLPPYVAQAAIASEDKDFYHHKGISLIGGMLRAIKDTWRTKTLQGGSTITQQLIKTSLLSPERTIERKLKEIILAIWAEQIYTKDQILEMYLNQIAYGGSAYGIQEAARTYFGKDANQLTISEAALLAGLTRAPSVYSPFAHPELAIKRRNEVLNAMEELKMITPQQKQQAVTTTLMINQPKTAIRAPHFVFYTKYHLEREYGLKQVEEGGLRVLTTLDLEIQQEAEKILKEELAKVAYLNISNGGIVVTSPNTGEILAMVGSKDYFEQPFGAFNVTVALRQPGSSLKPVLYALALEKGYTAATIIDDSPISFFISPQEVYRPVNYDGKFHGRLPLRFTLANSYNIPAVKLIQALGVNQYVEYATRLGITTWNDPSRFGLSLALGGGEVRMIDMAEVFGVFANSGYRVNISSVRQLFNVYEQVLYELDPKGELVMNPGVAYIISDILSDNFARQAAFGRGSALEIPGYQVAVKTGTTDSKKDNWTVGYTSQFVVVVWVGNNDGTPMNPYLASGITGAAPIWNRVMRYLLENKVGPKGKITFIRPSNVVHKPCWGRNELFLFGTESSVNCQPTVIKPQAKEAEQATP